MKRMTKEVGVRVKKASKSQRSKKLGKKR
jgi:hypothetical protein